MNYKNVENVMKVLKGSIKRRLKNLKSRPQCNKRSKFRNLAIIKFQSFNSGCVLINGILSLQY